MALHYLFTSPNTYLLCGSWWLLDWMMAKQTKRGIVQSENLTSRKCNIAV
jgi:hypothetical protein